MNHCAGLGNPETGLLELATIAPKLPAARAVVSIGRFIPVKVRRCILPGISGDVIPHRDVRQDLLFTHEPAEECRSALSRVGIRRLGLELKAALDPNVHRLRRVHFRPAVRVACTSTMIPALMSASKLSE